MCRLAILPSLSQSYLSHLRTNLIHHSTVSKAHRLRPDVNRRSALHFAASADAVGEAVQVLLKEVSISTL